MELECKAIHIRMRLCLLTWSDLTNDTLKSVYHSLRNLQFKCPISQYHIKSKFNFLLKPWLTLKSNVCYSCVKISKFRPSSSFGPNRAIYSLNLNQSNFHWLNQWFAFSLLNQLIFTDLSVKNIFFWFTNLQ